MKLDNVIAVRDNKTVYRDGDKCIKVFNESVQKADVLNEALNLARMEDTGLNIPNVLEVTMIDGKWAIVYNYIEGDTLSDLMEREPKRLDEFLELFVNLQLLVQSKTCPLLTKLRDKMSRKISMTDIDSTIRYDLHTRLNGMPRRNKVCHGDFNPSNIVITKDGSAYILDWSHVTQGNGAADAARTYMLFKLDGKDEIADRYFELYSKKSRIKRTIIQKWMPIVAATQLLKNKENEHDFLMNWINVVDYQ